MGSEKLEVILCDSIEQFRKKYKKIDSKCNVLCLTKNIDLFLTCPKLFTNVEVKIVEGQKTYMELEYVEQVWDILDEINECIRQAVVDRSYIYEMSYHLEGESEAMHIAEMLILNDVFDDFLGKYTNIRVFCDYNEIYMKEIEQLLFWCKKHKQKISVDFSQSTWNAKKLRLFLLCLFGEKAFEKMMRIFAIIKNTQKIAKIKKKVRSWNVNEEKEQTTDIGIIKGTAFAKDYNWTKDYLDILSKANIDFRFICVNDEVKQQWEKYGYKADNLERGLQIGVLNKRLRESRNIKKKIRYFVKNLLAKKADWGDIRQLRMIINSFLCYSVIDGVISDIAAEAFFKKHHYKIIDLHSDTNNIISKVCSFNAKKCSDKVKVRNCGGGFPLLKGISYEPYSYLSDFSFVIENEEGRYSKALKHQEKSVGKKYEIKNITYSKDFYQNLFDSNLLNNDLCVLWAPSYPEIGGDSYINFIQTGLHLIDFFASNCGKLIIKFHPHQRENEIIVFKEKSERSNNIIVEPSTTNIKVVLEQVDIMVTCRSMSIMDAVVKRKAVISVASEREYQSIEHLKEGLYIVRSYEELDKLLQKLKDDVYRKEWIAERIRKQDNYFSQLIDNGEGMDKMVQVIKKEMIN